MYRENAVDGRFVHLFDGIQLSMYGEMSQVRRRALRQRLLEGALHDKGHDPGPLSLEIQIHSPGCLSKYYQMAGPGKRAAFRLNLSGRQAVPPWKIC